MLGRVTYIDWRFVCASILLFVITAFLPEVPLFSTLLSSISGIKLFVMLAEALVVVFAMFAYPSSMTSVLSKSAKFILLGWCWWMLMSVVLSDHFAPSLVRFSETLWHILFVQALYVFFNEKADLKWLVRNFIVFGFVLYTTLLGMMLLSTDIGLNVSYTRIFLGFHHIRHFGYYALIVLFITIELLRRAQEVENVRQEIAYLCIMVGVWSCLFVLGGRGPFFAFIFALSSLVVVKGRYFTKRYLLSIFVTMSAGLLVSLPLSDESFGVLRIFHSTVSSDSLNEVSSGRLSIWKDVFRHSLSAPLFGEGPDGYLFTVSQQSYPTTIHPHGVLPQSVLEWGWPGALLFLLLLGNIVRNVITKIRQPVNVDYVVVGGLGTLTAILAFSMVDGVLYHPRPTLLFCVVLALLLSDSYQKDTVAGSKVKLGLNAAAVVPMLLVTFLHALSIHAALQRNVTDLTDESITYLKFFPSALAAPGLVSNIANWSHGLRDNESAQALSQWYVWAEKHSSRPWLFAYLNAEQLYGVGEQEKADAVMSPYKGHMPKYIQDAYECLQERL